MGESKDVAVSICCLAYNHEKYIRKTLEGFVTQKTSFKYEVLIHDDCSTDNTVSIIKEYEEKYPDIIKPIYQDENKFSQGIKVSYTYQFPRAKGKYIAMCEGDDFWEDCTKLQKQYDALEKEKECSMSTHIVRRIYENGEDSGVTQPKIATLEKFRNSNILDINFFFEQILVKDIIPFQTSSYFFRTEYVKEYIDNLSEYPQIKGVGDLPMLWFMLTKGSIFFIPDIMSSYRVNSNGSISEKMVKDNQKKIKHYYDMIAFFKAYDIYTSRKYSQYIELLILQYEFTIYELGREYKSLIKKQYRFLLKERTLNYIIYVWLCAIFPLFEKIYLKFRKC